MRAMVGGVSLKLLVLCNNIAATVTLPALQACIYDADHQGSDRIRRAGTLECDAGVLAEEPAEIRTAGEHLGPKTYEDGLHCNVAPTVVGGVGSGAQ